MTCSLWYDRWQMDCCGTPFALGSRVCWPVTVREHPLLPEDLREQLGSWDYDFDSHDNDPERPYYTLWGTVQKIRGVYIFYRQDEERRAWMPDSGLTLPGYGVGEFPGSHEGARLDAWLAEVAVEEMCPLREGDQELWG